MGRLASGTQQHDVIIPPDRLRVLTGSYARNSNDPKVEQSSADSALEVVYGLGWNELQGYHRNLDATVHLREVRWRHGMSNKDITVNSADLVLVSDDGDGTTTTTSHDASSDISTDNGSEPYSDSTSLSQGVIGPFGPGDYLHIYWKVTTGSTDGQAELFNIQLAFNV